VHHDFLLVDGIKMSKSLQNFYNIDDILSRNINPLAVRLMFMQTNYRKPLNFTWDSLEVAASQLKKLEKFASHQHEIGAVNEQYLSNFKDALCDDINTAKALALLWELLGDTSLVDADKWATLLVFDEVLGFDLKNTPKFVITDEAQLLVQQRDDARAAKDFATSDKLRGVLEALGYDVSDTPEGTKLS
jgi:cysteinyl-tRNA synthetase